MKAKLINKQENARNYGHAKQLTSSYSVVGKRDGQLVELVDVRCYMGRSSSASTVYASIWVKMKDGWTSGTGSAGGYGYDKESSAIGAAIRNAGIELYGNQYADKDGMVFNYETKQREKENLKQKARIDGVGESAIRSAVEAIARMAGGRGQLLIV